MPEPHPPEPSVPTLTALELRDGRLVVAKIRRGSPAVAATVAEARWLAEARHPGVVVLRRVACEEGRLETAHAGLATLRTFDPGPQATAELLALVATTVGELHRLRLVHGRLRPEHVILTGPGRVRPVLCSPGGDPDPGSDRQGLADLARFAAERVRPAPGLRGRRQRELHRSWAHTAEVLAHDGHLGPWRAARLFEALALRRSSDG